MGVAQSRSPTEERAALIEAARRGVLPVVPELRFAKVAGWWLGRYERKVATGERRERTLEAHRYHLDHQSAVTSRQSRDS